MASDPAARARLHADTIYEILHGSQRPTSGFTIVPTLSFSSYATLQATVNSGAIPAYIKAVLYDNEAWPQTPESEQQNPGSFYRQAAALAHSHGLLLVATPALDLTNVTSHVSGAAAPEAYLRAGLAASTSQAADVEDIQAQRLVPDLTSFSTFVAQAAAQARAANPKVTVIAGLSTCAGGDPTAAMLLAAARASLPYVAGWWMNIPGNSSQASGCGAPQPAGAISFIDQLPRP